MQLSIYLTSNLIEIVSNNDVNKVISKLKKNSKNIILNNEKVFFYIVFFQKPDEYPCTFLSLVVGLIENKEETSKSSIILKSLLNENKEEKSKYNSIKILDCTLIFQENAIFDSMNLDKSQCMLWCYSVKVETESKINQSQFFLNLQLCRSTLFYNNLDFELLKKSNEKTKEIYKNKSYTDENINDMIIDFSNNVKSIKEYDQNLVSDTKKKGVLNILNTSIWYDIFNPLTIDTALIKSDELNDSFFIKISIKFSENLKFFFENCHKKAFSIIYKLEPIFKSLNVKKLIPEDLSFPFQISLNETYVLCLEVEKIKFDKTNSFKDYDTFLKNFLNIIFQIKTNQGSSDCVYFSSKIKKIIKIPMDIDLNEIILTNNVTKYIPKLSETDFQFDIIKKKYFLNNEHLSISNNSQIEIEFHKKNSCLFNNLFLVLEGKTTLKLGNIYFWNIKLINTSSIDYNITLKFARFNDNFIDENKKHFNINRDFNDDSIENEENSINNESEQSKTLVLPSETCFVSQLNQNSLISKSNGIFFLSSDINVGKLDYSESFESKFYFIPLSKQLNNLKGIQIINNYTGESVDIGFLIKVHVYQKN